ncbi:MAG TPA: rRNA pseudouridine synthase [Herminiimonas sp.]|jgi:23S rRNA pseudouridine2604 synthase|nr:rRNA pseudouridine synthase [Herminiimonas sp.]
MTDSLRLAKRVAETFSCSRREAEQYIEGGWVTVDGVIVEEPGHRVSLQQVLALSPDATLTDIDPVTILLHKPAGIEMEAALQMITPHNLFADDRSGTRFLKKHLSDLRPTQALETYASGLVVFTQDWRVARKLIDDGKTVEHEYIAEVDGGMVADGLKLLSNSLTKVSWQNETRLRFALKASEPGLIAKLCGRVDLTVIGLKRIRIGRIPMANLPMGQWRYLKGYERF